MKTKFVFRTFAIDMNMFMFLPKEYRDIDLSKYNKQVKPDILNGTDTSETTTNKNDSSITVTK